MNDKDAARQAFRDQQLQDTEGGIPCPISFIAGFLDGCRHKDKSLINGSRMKQMNERIEELLEENAKMRESLDKIDNSNDDMKYFNMDIHKIIYETRQVLKELDEEL
jgi:hypothetical protein